MLYLRDIVRAQAITRPVPRTSLGKPLRYSSAGLASLRDQMMASLRWFRT
jgi:hypothetical protein